MSIICTFCEEPREAVSRSADGVTAICEDCAAEAEVTP